ncbi:MAG: MarR family transcriptional regulator, partial [Chloroflexota bacterium]
MDEKISEAELSRTILETIPLITRILEASLRQFQRHLSPIHFGLLKMLAMTGPLPQSELAEKLQSSPSTFSATVEALVKRGWLHRKPSTEDRRVTFIEISPAGREALDQLDQQALVALEKMVSPLAEPERAQLLAGLNVLRAAITNTP